jgi:3-deoxy-7-phosphoheptulonate synthase
VHDPVAAVEYAERLAALREQLADRLEIVMRVYFEKPHDGRMEGADQRSQPRRLFRYQQGLRLARNVLSAVNNWPAGRHRIPRHDDAATTLPT